MRRRALACALASSVSIGAPVDAWAASARAASLSWARLDGAESCIGAGELGRAVEATLGRRVLVSAAEAELSIEGRVGPSAPGGYAAVVRVSDAHGALLGERSFETPSADCRALDETLSLAVALMIDPEAALATEPPPSTEPSPAPSPPATVPEPRATEPTSPPQEPPAPGWRGDVSTGVGLGFGVLPSVAPSLVLSGSLEPPWFVPVESVLTVSLPQSLDAPSGPRVDLFSLRGSGYLCPLAHRGEVLSARACAGVEVGLLAGSGPGLGAAEAGVRPHVGFALRGRLAANLAGPLGLYGATTVGAAVLRDGFDVERDDGARLELFQPSVVSGSAELGLELRFP